MYEYEDSPDDRGGFADLHAALERHKATIQPALMAQAMKLPAVAALMAEGPREPPEVSEERTRRALVGGEWDGMLRHLQNQGTELAGKGLPLGDWYSLTTAVRDALVGSLIDEGLSPPTLKRTLRAFGVYTDRALHAVASGYVEEKRRLAARAAQDALESARERDLYRELFRSCSLGLLIYHRETGEGPATFRLVEANAATADHFGVDQRDAIGVPLDERGTASPSVGLEAILELAVGGEVVRREVTSGDGRRALLVHAFQLAEETAGVLVEDVTAKKRLEEQSRRYTRELKRSNEELEQFAYVASHDLQEPLRMVASYTELLAQRYEGQLDERADKYIHYAVDGAKRMKALIDDLLQFSRVTSRGTPPKPVSLDEVVDIALRNLEMAVREAGVAIERPAQLGSGLGDEVQLVLLFQNLIHNALKFRRDEAPRVAIRAEHHDDRFVVAVEDNGIGIDPGHEERVFRMFQRLHERAKYPGTGVGLAVAKKIVDRHAGRIWYESTPGQGTTFFVELPTATTETESTVGDDATVEVAATDPSDAQQPPAGADEQGA